MEHVGDTGEAPFGAGKAFLTAYRDRFGFELLEADGHGELTGDGPGPTPCSCNGPSAQRRRVAAESTLRWGRTVIDYCCEDGFALWAVPVRQNQRTVGILAVQGIDLDEADTKFHHKVQVAADGLLEMAVETNLIHPLEISVARERAAREGDRFEVLEASKRHAEYGVDELRSQYSLVEPQLLTAIKSGRETEARSILNRILTTIYGVAGERLELLKSCILELVVMMHRAAVEAGADPAEMFGSGYRALTHLASIEDEEDLSDWVRGMLEILMKGIGRNHRYPHSLLLMRAVNFMRQNLREPLRRDDVARIAGISPGHFSKLMTERMGSSFSQLLLKMRVDRARELLAGSHHSLGEIAAECGFCDQSHFAKVFRSMTSESPGCYRRRSQSHDVTRK